MTRKQLPRLVDLMEKPPFPGSQITIKSILDQEVTVTAFRYIPSQFEERKGYLAIQVRRDSEEQWFTTTSIFIIGFFERLSPELLPCLVTFAKDRDASGRWIYIIR